MNFEEFLAEAVTNPPAGFKKQTYTSYKTFEKDVKKCGYHMYRVGRNPNRQYVVRGKDEGFRAGPQLGHFDPKYSGGTQDKDAGIGWLFVDKTEKESTE